MINKYNSKINTDCPFTNDNNEIDNLYTLSQWEAVIMNNCTFL